MTLRNRQTALFIILFWLVSIIFFMILSTYFDLELYFGLSFLGILIMIEMLDTVFVKPRYILYLRYVVAAGVIIFGAIVARKILEILNT
jgi:hypothetical protein